MNFYPSRFFICRFYAKMGVVVVFCNLGITLNAGKYFRNIFDLTGKISTPSDPMQLMQIYKFSQCKIQNKV